MVGEFVGVSDGDNEVGENVVGENVTSVGNDPLPIGISSSSGGVYL